MSIEDVKNGGPASWYVGTEEAIRENRGDMGEHGKKISPEEVIEYATKTAISAPTRYEHAIAMSSLNSCDKLEAFGFLNAIAMLCPERLEK